MRTNNHYLRTFMKRNHFGTVIRKVHRYCQFTRTRTLFKLWCDMCVHGLCLAKRLHYPNRNRKINSGTYPFQAFRFFSFVHLSLDAMCVHVYVYFFFLLLGSLVCTSCYLICVVYHFARYITCIWRTQWPRSCCDSRHTVNASAVFSFCPYTYILQSFRKLHI